MLHDRRDEIDIVAEAFDFEAVECRDLKVGGFVACRAPRHQLGDHRVVEDRHFAAFLDPRIDAHAIDAACLAFRSEEHTSELQSLMRISYAVFCLKKKK